MLKIVFLAILIEACSIIPPAPEIVQYGVYQKTNPPGFYGVDSYNHQRFYHDFTDKEMNAAQCLTRQDYSSFQRWITNVKLIAQQRCTCR